MKITTKTILLKEQQRILYGMSRFDILIRSSSYFSRVAELMGNHKIIIYPVTSYWQKDKLIVDYYCNPIST